MSLKNVSTDARQIIKPDNFDEVVIERPVSTQSPPDEEDVEVTLTGYSSSFGGQLVDRDYEIVEKTINDDGNLEIALSTTDGEQGGDYVVEYSVDDGTGTVDVAQFFYQNGIYSDSDAGDLTYRASAELERFSGTFTDGQTVEEATNFADLDGDFINFPDLNFATTSSVYRKHNGEPIPYFEGSGLLEFPDDPFTSRSSSIFLALQWEQDFDENFIVAKLNQGNKTYLEVRNQQDHIEVRSDFADTKLYDAFQYAGNIIVVSCVIDPSSSLVRGSVNREITTSPASLNGESFLSEFAELALNPEGQAKDGIKLFDVITYDEAISEENENKISKQLSYLYGADMTSPGIEKTGTSPSRDKAGSGSPKIQNHMFFNEDVLKYDVLLAGDPVESYDVSVDPGIREWDFSASGSAVAFNAHRKSVVADESSNDVSLLTSEGEEIWSFGGHGNTVNAVESGKQYEAYSASDDGTVRKIGKRGTEVWTFNDISDGEAFRSLALYDELALYVGTSDGTVRRIVETDGTESWRFDFIENSSIPSIDSLEVDKSERIYAAGSNGVLRSINKDGNELYNTVPFEDEFTESGVFQEEPISDLAVVDESLIVVSGPFIKKLDSVNGSVDWKIGPIEIDNQESDLQAVAVDPSGSVFVYGFEPSGSSQIGKLYKIENGSIVAEPVELTDSEVRNISIQPGSPEPHWRT